MESSTLRPLVSFLKVEKECVPVSAGIYNELYQNIRFLIYIHVEQALYVFSYEMKNRL
jgi:hypothetical protein